MKYLRISSPCQIQYQRATLNSTFLHCSFHFLRSGLTGSGEYFKMKEKKNHTEQCTEEEDLYENLLRKEECLAIFHNFSSVS